MVTRIMTMDSVNGNKIGSEEKEKHWSQILALLIGSLGVITNGLLFSWSSPFIPKLTKDKENYDITEDEASYFGTLQPLATLITSGIFSYTSDVIGRRKTLLMIAVPHVCCWILTASAKSVYVFYVARILAGIADAAVYGSFPMYIGEIASPEVRGTWGNCLASAMFLGEFLINVIGAYFGVKATAYICLPLPVIFAVMFYFMPDSPYFCIMKGRYEEAKESLRFFKRKKNVEVDFVRLKADVDRQMSEKGTWLDMVKIDSNRRALIAAAFLRISQQIGGLSVFYMYTQLIFEKSGGDVAPEVSSMLYMGLCFGLNLFVVTFLMSRIRRRTSFIISLSPCAVVLYGMAIYFYLEQYVPEVDVTSFSWLPLTGMILYQIFSSFGITIIPTLMLGELFSASIKSKAMTVLVMVFSVSSFMANMLFYALLSRFGIYAPFLFFAVSNTVSAVLSIYLIPETKGKTLEEIQQMLKNKGNKK
ncbi:unnamed protein product [Phaedon cochleariae]|uniref:Major facilitator superfamily (MFS) profile domain-containing protein n=1 Tax=Phaedon cochleariae TaxID=80249 RepID=A0A9P0DTA5_PHACE|nr:unnamed protein product [Phaedon cochleariae]